MENSANQENAKQQQAEDQQHNIETVTPDLENMHPLSRQEDDPNPQDNTQEALPVQDKSDDAETAASDEENTSTSAEQTGESDQGDAETAAENKSGDPRDDIETVSP